MRGRGHSPSPSEHPAPLALTPPLAWCGTVIVLERPVPAHRTPWRPQEPAGCPVPAPPLHAGGACGQCPVPGRVPRGPHGPALMQAGVPPQLCCGASGPLPSTWRTSCSGRGDSSCGCARSSPPLSGHMRGGGQAAVGKGRGSASGAEVGASPDAKLPCSRVCPSPRRGTGPSGLRLQKTAAPRGPPEARVPRGLAPAGG